MKSYASWQLPLLSSGEFHSDALKLPDILTADGWTSFGDDIQKHFLRDGLEGFSPYLDAFIEHVSGCYLDDIANIAAVESPGLLCQ